MFCSVAAASILILKALHSTLCVCVYAIYMHMHTFHTHTQTVWVKCATQNVL